MNILKIRFVKFIVISFIFLLAFFIYNNYTTKKTMKDWCGTYASEVPSLDKSFFMLLKHKRENLRFVPDGVKKLYLNIDSTYTITEVAGGDRVVNFYGTWELNNNKPVLKVGKSDFQIKEFPFNSLVYYDEYLKQCQDTTLTTLRINVFKKID